MTDREKREDDKLKKLIHDAYDFSDEQLLAELEEAKATLSDSDFSGIEDRMYQKLHKRLEEETHTDESLEKPSSNDLTAISATSPKRKRSHSKKKKIAMVGLLAAAFVGMLGVTAVGEKNYFFRGREIDRGVIFNNDKNTKYDGELEDAYRDIEESLEIDVLKLGYIPKGMVLNDVTILENKAVLKLKSDELVLYFIQEKSMVETSIGTNSNRKNTTNNIYNVWLKENIELEEERLENNILGYGVSINCNNSHYRLMGQLSKEEMMKVVQNLNFK